MQFRRKEEEKTPALLLEGRILEARLARENLEALQQEAGVYLLEAEFLELLASLVDEAGHREREIGMKLDQFLMEVPKSFRVFHPRDVDAAITEDVSPLRLRRAGT